MIIPVAVRSVLLVALLSITVQAQDTAAALELLKATETIFTTRIREAEPSVVSIARVRTQASADVPTPQRGAGDEVTSPNLIPNEFGTGVIVRENGLILTMYHVVRGGPTKAAQEPGARQLIVRLNDRRVFSAYIHAADPRSDLAILKIDAVGLKPLALDFDGTVQKGQYAIALGNPYAIAQDGSPSASWGVISNLGRAAGVEPAEDPAEGQQRQTVHHLGTLLQLDMRVDLGGSGSAVLNLDGRLIGLTTSLAALPGYEKSSGFAVPIDARFRRIIEDLIAGREVSYGFLGIGPQDVPVHRLVGLPNDAPHKLGGATFSNVVKNTPADNRLAERDIVLEVLYRPFGRTETVKTPIYSANDLMREVGLMPPGSEIELRLFRDMHDSILSVPITLGKWPAIDEEGIVAPNRQYVRGLLVDYATARKKFLSRKFGSITEAPVGVLVLDVAPDSPAATIDIQAGDLILRVNRTPVTTPKQLADALKDDTATATLQLERGTRELPAK